VGANDGTKLVYDGIPFASVVGPDGKIVWAGHPMQPEFAETVFKVLLDHRKELTSAIVAARGGNLGKAYEELGKSDAPGAGVARQAIESNLQARLGHAAALQGVEKYSALDHTLAAYKGVTGTEDIPRELAALESKPQIKKAIDEARVMKDLETKITELQKKAVALEKEKSQDAAANFYFTQMIGLLSDFVEHNPEHKAVEDITRGLETLKVALKQLQEQTGAGRADAEDAGR
jgi:hypothetical protein